MFVGLGGTKTPEKVRIKTMPRRKSSQNKTPKVLRQEQVRAIYLYTQGVGKEEIAKELSVSLATIYEWFRNEVFASEVTRVQREMVVEAQRNLKPMLSKAIRHLHATMLEKDTKPLTDLRGNLVLDENKQPVMVKDNRALTRKTSVAMFLVNLAINNKLIIPEEDDKEKKWPQIRKVLQMFIEKHPEMSNELFDCIRQVEQEMNIMPTIEK